MGSSHEGGLRRGTAYKLTACSTARRLYSGGLESRERTPSRRNFLRFSGFVSQSPPIERLPILRSTFPNVTACIVLLVTPAAKEPAVLKPAAIWLPSPAPDPWPANTPTGRAYRSASAPVGRSGAKDVDAFGDIGSTVLNPRFEGESPASRRSNSASGICKWRQ